ncbi:MAG: hypothetical protein JSR96_09100 [Proteobacteria bacterium]|nr:hypothetical protein [Pseudomonadota bacterium]
MTRSPGKSPLPNPKRKQARRRASRKPDWADGLRKLYDDVVAEPLPDSFEQLLNKLDQASDD